MVERVINRDTLVDVTVNVVPLAVLLAFVVLFVAYDPWGWDPFPVLLSIGLLVVPFATLAVVTYAAARAIARDERRSGDRDEAAAMADPMHQTVPGQTEETDRD